MRALISDVETRLEEPTAKGLAHAVTRTVRDGLLHSGDQLPPIRTIAHELALSPTTVSAAWRMLAAAGTIRTAGRRGTVVADFHAPREGRHRQVSDRQRAFSIDLSTGVPDADLLPGLVPVIRGLTTAGTPGSYLDAPVLPELSEHLEQTWPYAAPSLTVVDGAMDAMELVIRSTLQFGDRVLVEDPTFPPMLDLLDAAGVIIEGVPLDAEGVIPRALELALESKPAAVFLQPRAQNPTGVSITPARLKALAKVLRRSDALIVEDDSAGAISDAPDLTFGHALPERTVHIRSYSKSHGPDLRLAAMSGPEDLIAGVHHLRQLGQGWSSRLLQRVLLSLLQDPGAIRQVAFARQEYARRRTTFVDTLTAAGIPTLGRDGLNLWVPVHDEATAVMQLAVSGIAVAPGRPFQVVDRNEPHVRVTVGLASSDAPRVAALVAEAAASGRWARSVR